jgi:hypothetical protein
MYSGEWQLYLSAILVLRSIAVQQRGLKGMPAERTNNKKKLLLIVNCRGSP